MLTRLLILGLIFIFPAHSNAQIFDLIASKEYNKDKSLYLSKKFVIEEVLGTSKETVLFDIDPLSSTSSLEVTSLVYSCPAKGKEGIIFTFWGDNWNDNGVTYSGYGFKNLNKDSAVLLLERIRKEIDYLMQYQSALPDSDANTYFTFAKMTFLLKPEKYGASIRIFWRDFDAEWTTTAFERTKRKMEKWFKNK